MSSRRERRRLLFGSADRGSSNLEGTLLGSKQAASRTLCLAEARRCARRRTDSLLPRRQWALVENHPVQTEPILHLSKAEGKERLFHRHQDTTAVRQRGENALCLDIAIRSQRQVSTAHRFSVWDVRRHQLVIANYNTGVQHRVLPFWPDTALVGRLRVRHHHANLCSEMPLVVAESLRTVATEIHVGIHSHKLVSSFSNSRDRCF